MKQFGLIGYPLSHSFSKGYFTRKFETEQIADCVYDVYPIEQIAMFDALCQQHPDFVGLNVTIPYKEQVIPMLDELDDEARQVGAVNTILFHDGKKTGYNSDIYGFEQSLRPLLGPQHTFALILGTGGASKAVEYVLKKLGIAYQYVSRTRSEKSVSYEELPTTDAWTNARLIVNTTPLGMYPNVEECPPLPYDDINGEYLLYDLTYNPEETRFLREGSSRGAQTKNGLDMLYLQAERSWQIWNAR